MKLSHRNDHLNLNLLYYLTYNIIVMRALNWLTKRVVKIRLEGPINLQMYREYDAANRKSFSSWEN